MILDPENPLVYVDFPFINAVQYADVVIPCKPTSKKVELELIKDGDRVRAIFLFIVSN